LLLRVLPLIPNYIRKGRDFHRFGRDFRHLEGNFDQLRKWHATRWPSDVSFSRGTSRLHSGNWRIGQRVWKWQPLGGWIGLGTSPFKTMRWRRSSG